MKQERWILLFATFLVMVLLMDVEIVFAQAKSEEKTKIAVLDFKAIGSKIDREFGEGVSEILRTALIKTGKYTVIERSQLKKVIDELKIQRTQYFDEKTAIRIGKLVGAKTVVIGSIVKFGVTYTLTPRFVDVETGISRKGENLTCRGEDNIPKLCNQVVEMIVGEKISSVSVLKAKNDHSGEIKIADILGVWGSSRYGKYEYLPNGIGIWRFEDTSKGFFRFRYSLRGNRLWKRYDDNYADMPPSVYESEETVRREGSELVFPDSDIRLTWIESHRPYLPKGGEDIGKRIIGRWEVGGWEYEYFPYGLGSVVAVAKDQDGNPSEVRWNFIYSITKTTLYRWGDINVRESDIMDSPCTVSFSSSKEMILHGTHKSVWRRLK